MPSPHSYYVAWRQAHRIASIAERRLYYRQRNLEEVAADSEKAETHALRARATALLKRFLSETRTRAAALR